MKISAESYNHMKAQIASIGAPKAFAHRQFIINEGKSKDIEKRLRWDLSYYANLTAYVCDEVYSQGCDDTHVDAALRSIMRDLGYVSH